MPLRSSVLGLTVAAFLAACAQAERIEEPAVDTGVELAPEPLAEVPVPIEPPPPVDCTKMDPNDQWARAFLQRAMPGSGVLMDPAGNRLQVLIGEIDSSGERPCITWHPYRMDAEYIYPASAIKPITAVAALHSFRARLAEEPALAGVLLGTPVKVAYRVQGEIDARAKAKSMPPPKPGAKPIEPPPPSVTSVAREIRASLAVSNNPSYNFTVDLAGYSELHELMWDAGLKSVKLRHRLAIFGLSNKDQRTTARLALRLPKGEMELVPERVSTMQVPLHGRARSGVGLFRKEGGQVIPGPKDFSEKNSVSLLDMARLTAWIADPALVPSLEFPLLEPEDRVLLAKSMSYLHSDWEEWMPLRVGLVDVIPEDDLLYLHKSGMAYGFYLDVGYVQQKSTGRAFVLAVAAHLNPNGVINDGQYGYKTLGTPMMKALGKRLGQELLVEKK